MSRSRNKLHVINLSPTSVRISRKVDLMSGVVDRATAEADPVIAEVDRTTAVVDLEIVLRERKNFRKTTLFPAVQNFLGGGNQSRERKAVLAWTPNC